MVRGGDPRITGVRVASFSDCVGRGSPWPRTPASPGRAAAPGARSGVLALANDGDETYTGNGSTVGFSPDDLDLDEAAGDAVLRCTRLFGATAVPSQRLAIVLEPRLAASVVGLLGGTLTGERVLKGRSPFADRTGEAIASPLLTLVDDPTDHRSYGADTYDGEGLACRRNSLVVDGVLQGFLYDSASARRAGTVSTGSAVRGISSTPSRRAARRWPSLPARAPTRSCWPRSTSASTCSR